MLSLSLLFSLSVSLRLSLPGAVSRTRHVLTYTCPLRNDRFPSKKVFSQLGHQPFIPERADAQAVEKFLKL